ncbi:MAG: maleylpyruvate isomerase family mycothiol-dependent enzyme [Micromonosporaceae bacterium]|nr:maleylpyruvate isomerase family mycothiol-dependent enzyme [Micromonosporaceae bacterium]
MDPLVLLPDLERATTRLLNTVRGLTNLDLAAPSLLPGWSRGHVLAHVARNADSLCNLLTWARTGVETPQYASQEQRDADIEAGAPRPAAAQLEDLDASAGRFAAMADETPAEAWAARVRTRGGRHVVAATLVWGRLREVEIHHVDLNAGYPVSAWSDTFSQHLLREVAADFAGRSDALRAVLRALDLGRDLAIGEDGPVVEGPSHGIAAWLIGRSDGSDLTVGPEGPLPPVPAWR